MSLECNEDGARVIRSPLASHTLAPLKDFVNIITPLSSDEHYRVSALLSSSPGVFVNISADQVGAIALLEALASHKRFSITVTSKTDRRFFEAIPPEVEALSIVGSSARSRIDIGWLGKYRSIRFLSLLGVHQGLAALAELPRLEVLSCVGLGPDAFPVSNLATLRRLSVMLGRSKSLDCMSDLRRLEYLGMCRVSGLTDISALGGVRSLRALHLESLGAVTAMPRFEPDATLDALYIVGLKALSDITGLNSLHQLQSLRVGLTPKVSQGVWKTFVDARSIVNGIVQAGVKDAPLKIGAGLPVSLEIERPLDYAERMASF